MQKLYGIIDKFFPPNHYGFIITTNADGSVKQNYFFHGSQVIEGTPRSGMHVKFVESRNKKGFVAIAVEVIPTGRLEEEKMRDDLQKGMNLLAGGL